MSEFAESEHGASSGMDIGDVIAHKFLSIYDSRIRKRNLLNLFLAVASMVLFMAEIWLAYDRDLCWEGAPPEPDFRVKDCLRETNITEILKITISGITFLLMGLVIDYYRLQLRTEKKSYWFITDSVQWRKYVWFFLAGELLILLPHTFPTFQKFTYDDKVLGSLMFLRLYMGVRVLRDHSPVYRRRMDLLADSFIKRSGAVEFNWLLCVKFLFLQHMWAFVILGVLVVWFLMAYIIWIFERQVQSFFTLEISVWMTCITMTTVGYGDVSPADNSARICAGIAAVLGIILSALLVFAVMDSLTLSPQDTRVRNLFVKRQTHEKQKRWAAQYLALCYRHYVVRSEFLARGALQSEEWLPILREFNSKNAFMKGILRRCRRDLNVAMELDDLVIARLDEKMDDMTGSIADRLAFRLGLRPQMRQKSLSSIVTIRARMTVMEEEQLAIMSKIDQVLKVLLKANSSLFEKIFT